MKIPMHIKFTWLMGKYYEKFSFWQGYALLQHLRSILQYCEKLLKGKHGLYELSIKTSHVHQVLVEKDEFIVNFANFCIFLFFERFCRSVFAIFWWAQCISNTKLWTMPSPQKQPILPIYFAFQALLLTKIYFWHFWGAQNVPLKPKDLKTSGYGA